MSEMVDCRGLSCPEPVMMTRSALQQSSGEMVTVVVSNAVARDNVSRAAKSMGWQVAVKTEGDDYILKITK